MLALQFCRLQITDNATIKTMENERTIYETVMGIRVNDVHWWRTKNTMRTAELPLTKLGFELFIALRKTSPRYFSQYHKIKGQVSKVESSIGEGCTGERKDSGLNLRD